MQELLVALAKLATHMPPAKTPYAEKLRKRIIAAAEAKDALSLSALAVELQARAEEYEVAWKDALQSVLDAVLKAAALGIPELFK